MRISNPMGWFGKAKSLFQSTKVDVTSRFELLREAVHGTMSDFYMARDRESDRIVGLKILDIEKTAAFEARFKGLDKPTEGEIGLLLKHPRIVRTIEHGLTTASEQFVVLEYVEGAGLNTHLLDRNTALNGKRIALCRQMAESVEAVHKAGFIHRDICPRNFICSKDLSSLKLIDFGLTVPATAKFMLPGNRTGTPSYMAPEIVRRRKTDHRLDIFALGVTFYQLCSFELPWPTHDVSGKAAMLHDTVKPIPIVQLRPRLNKALAEMIMACLSVRPDDRPASTAEVRRMLWQVRSEEGG